jgi:hypothetical protein
VVSEAVSNAGLGTDRARQLRLPDAAGVRSAAAARVEGHRDVRGVRQIEVYFTRWAFRSSMSAAA